MNGVDKRSFTALTESIGPARRYVRQRAEALAVAPDLLDDVELAASELISNAVEHGSGNDFSVGVGIDNDEFVLEVASAHSGQSLAEPSDWNAPPPDAVSGRGLHLVQVLSTDAWVRQVNGTLTVGCRFGGR